MKSINIFCWLFLFLATIFFQQVNSDDFDEYDDWEDDFAVIEDITDSLDTVGSTRGLIDKIKAMKVKKRCDCTVFKVCGCCVLLSIENETKHKACFNMTEITDKKNIELSLVFDNKKLYSKFITEEDKCANAPYTGKIGKICLVMYNMTVDHFGFHVCSKLSIKLLTKQLITFDFQCLLMDKKKITVERPSDDPNSALLNINIHKNLTVPHITVGKK